ncbi:acyl--CoA ligase (plasmid) [Skermanella mucosa]|uniref:class I adenylate-forming enzyme family protein n=1 Tax=Skermanella mucosa TaxID=1789672 RepID=UPI00192A87C9|nr:class I adenylate-forming enzyme family protein [Skermanella mucosa]UEM24777.1 acyl--CoA ligase [Skermanella mucosa]
MLEDLLERTAPERSAPSVEDWFRWARTSDSVVVDRTRSPFTIHRLSDLVAQADLDAEKWLALGVSEGTPVMLSCGTNLVFLRHLLALLRIGAVPVPTSNLLPTASYNAVRELVKPGAVVAPAARTRHFSEMEQAEHPFGDDTALLFDRRYLGPRPELAGCLIILSSGSTGVPKAVVHRAESAFLNARLHAESIEFEPGGRMLLALPAYFSYGLVAGVIATMQSHKDIILSEQPFSAANWFKVCDEEQVSLFATTPFQLRKLLAVGKRFPESLRKLTIGGDRVMPADLEALRRVYDGKIYLTYGLSEAGPRVFTNLLGDDRTLWNTAGRPMEGIEVTLHEPEHRDGLEIGELLVKTPTAMLGYLGESGFVRDDFIRPAGDGAEWLRTHDVFIRDPATGTYRYLERRKKVIVSGGEKLSAGYIREILLQHPLIAQAVVSPKPDRDLGEVPVADIQVEIGALEPTPAELTQWCRQRLRLIEIPRDFRFTDVLKVVNK